MLWLPKLLQLLSFLIGLANAETRLPVTRDEFSGTLKKYQTITHLKANFKQTKTFKDLTLKLKSEGNFEIQRPGKVIWQILKPSYVKVGMTETEFEIVTGSGKEQKIQKVNLSEVNASQKNGMTALVAWLQMDSEALFIQYEIFKTDKNFIFFPKQKKDSPFKSLEMNLDKKGNLSQLFIEETSGDSLQIEFDPPQILRDR